MLGLEADEATFARRAARLAKADLATKMVVEMTSLQGIMGCEYALRSGENRAVADAIGEQYQPVPKTKPGLAVALADRLDSLVGLFAVGLAPTGTKDPFGLRRAAIGVVQPLIEHNIDFDLQAALKSRCSAPDSPGYGRGAHSGAGVPQRASAGRPDGQWLQARCGGCCPGGSVEQPGWSSSGRETTRRLGRARGLEYTPARVCPLCAHYARPEDDVRH